MTAILEGAEVRNLGMTFRNVPRVEHNSELIAHKSGSRNGCQQELSSISCCQAREFMSVSKKCWYVIRQPAFPRYLGHNLLPEAIPCEP